MSRRGLPRLAAALLALALGLAAAQPSAALRLAHLSPDAPRVDLVIDGRLFLRDAAYGEVTPYRDLPAGEYEVSVFPHRLPDAQREQGAEPRPLESFTIVAQLDAAGYYTLALSGFYEPLPEEGGTGGLYVDVDPDEAEVQVVGPRGFSEAFSGDLELTGLEPGAYSVSAALDGFRPVTYELEVLPAETATASITLQRGEEAGAEEAQAAAAGATAAWRGLELHLYRDRLEELPPPGSARVRLLHLSPVTLPVDLLALPEEGGEPATIASELAFPNEGAYVRVTAAPVTLRLNLAGGGAVLSEVADVELAPGATYTFFLVREPLDNFLRLVPAVDAVVAARR